MADIRFNNSYSMAGGFNITNAEPIDSRMYVSDIEHIYLSNNWEKVKPYPGLIVSAPNGEVRICVNSDYTKTSSWKKVGSDVTVSGNVDSSSIKVSNSYVNVNYPENKVATNFGLFQAIADGEPLDKSINKLEDNIVVLIKSLNALKSSVLGSGTTTATTSGNTVLERLESIEQSIDGGTWDGGTWDGNVIVEFDEYKRSTSISNKIVITDYGQVTNNNIKTNDGLTFNSFGNLKIVYFTDLNKFGLTGLASPDEHDPNAVGIYLNLEQCTFSNDNDVVDNRVKNFVYSADKESNYIYRCNGIDYKWASRGESIVKV